MTKSDKVQKISIDDVEYNIDELSENGAEVEQLAGIEENVRFSLPKELRTPA